MKRPRILFLAPKAPYPLTSGLAMREFHLLRAYSTIASVELAFFASDEKQYAEVANGVGSYCERIHALPYSQAPRTRLIPWPGWRSIAYPALTRSFDSSALQRLVASVVDSIDLIHVGRLHLARSVEVLKTGQGRRPRLILDLDDIESVSQWRLSRVSPSLGWRRELLRYADLLRIAAYQRWILQKFDRVLVCSQDDRRKLGRSNVIVVPNGIEIPSEVQEETDRNTLLFCGLLSYRPNEDAVQFFVQSIFPAIRRQLPDTRLVVVGKAPSSALCALDDGVSVLIKRDVPQVAEYYRNATVAVVPLRTGGGTRIKVLEAWAHGVPVVSTSVGCEGLEAIAEEHLVVADTPDEFARACVQLLRSLPRREALARSGRELVRKRYRWEISTNSALLAVCELLGLPAPTITRETSEQCLA